MPPERNDDMSALGRAQERLYAPGATPQEVVTPLVEARTRTFPHEWMREPLARVLPQKIERRHVRLATWFFAGAVLFFLISLGTAAYFFYYGGNSVSVNKIEVKIQGPNTIAGGDTVPLLIAITNRNPVAVENATIEVDFPPTTRSADNVLQPYPRYVENLGTLASGATVTRPVKAVVFGGAGDALTLPITFSYSTSGSNAVFVRKDSYALAISSTPLSISVDAPSETVSGKPLTFSLTVRSNATAPISNVVLAGSFPFGFTVDSSSVPLTGSSFLLGTLAPGATKSILLTGHLTGTDAEQRVFHFSIGTANSAGDQTLAVSYMTQDASVAITAPFITTSLALNGDSSDNVILSPGARQNATLSYSNTLDTNVTNASVDIMVSGSAVDYSNIQTTNGFYRSSDHTIVFDSGTDPSLANMAPGASGIGSFTFETLPAGQGAAPDITFTISVSGTRVGQSNVPEQVSASATKSAKVSTTIAFSNASLHSSGPITNSGPIPPQANQPTTYTIVWTAQDQGSAVAGSTVTATLPSYMAYTGKTSGVGSFSFDTASRTVTWTVGDIPQGSTAQGFFQVTFTPSVSQHGTAPALTSAATFSGHDRFAGVPVSVTADAATTETRGDPGYSPAMATVQ